MAKKQDSSASGTVDDNKKPADGTKGRPTRTRREAEAARQRPLVPNDRKEAKRIAKQQREKAWERQQEALKTGDERYLPERDKGQVRRYTRNWLDARWSFAEFLLPAMLVFLVGMMVLSFVPLNDLASGALVWGLTLFFYALLFISIIEAFVVWQRMKRRIKVIYPDQPIPKGTWFYAYSRMLMPRRWRSPRPQVDRGAFPEEGTKKKK